MLIGIKGTYKQCQAVLAGLCITLPPAGFQVFSIEETIAKMAQPILAIPSTLLLADNTRSRLAKPCWDINDDKGEPIEVMSIGRILDKIKSNMRLIHPNFWVNAGLNKYVSVSGKRLSEDDDMTDVIITEIETESEIATLIEAGGKIIDASQPFDSNFVNNLQQ